MADAVATKKDKKSGDPAVRVAKPRPKRVFYPGLLDEKGEPTKKLTEYPEDYDIRVHKGVSRKSFVNEAPFLRHQADGLVKRAEALRAEAIACEKLGNAADRAKAKKLRHMYDVMAKLEKELTEQGIDVADLKAAAPAEAPKAPVAA